MLSPLFGQLSPLRVPTKVAPAGDADALAYIAAVEAADGQALEEGVATAFTDFIVGCKADGIWSAIKASCILAGARTLSGALVPLVGTAPTNSNFVSADYNRETGLKGNGTTKYLNSNRNNNADPQNSYHNSFYATSIGASSVRIMGGNANFYVSGDDVIGRLADGKSFVRNRNSSSNTDLTAATNNSFTGVSRSTSTGYQFRSSGISSTRLMTSQTPSGNEIRVFGGGNAALQSPTDARLSFYSIGESLDLAALDNRVSTLMTQINATL